jgi:capsular polysaccharide biosynthesis protein
MEVLANASVVALDFKVLDYAYVSPLASSDMPSWLIVLAVGIAVGIAAAVALPLFVEYWRDPIKGPGDLRRQNIEVLGVVPRVSRVA